MRETACPHERKLKIAYICLCHMDPIFVARTAKALSYENDGFFIHVDEKKDIEPFLSSCRELPNVFFVKDRVPNYWGGFNSIVATMRTLKLAFETNNYERFVLLQGQDYPIFSPKEIHNFFAKHRDIEFCKGKNISSSCEKKDYMKCCGFWLMDTKTKNFFVKAFRFALMKINRLGIKYRPASFKTKNEKWDIYHGWAQFALTRACIAHILDIYNSNQAYNKYMKHRFPPDEIYIPTIVHNSCFKENVSTNVIYRRNGEKTLLNLTYFEYPIQVTIFKEKEDYYWLKETGCLFVRKVNSSSENLLQEIDKHIK